MNRASAHGSVRPPRSGPARRRPGPDERGFLSLEWVLTVPVMAVIASLVIAAGFLVRDVLVLQEAARVGARVASTTAGDQAVRWAVEDAAPELAGSPLQVRVAPSLRRSGDQVEVEVTAERRYGPLSHRLRARSTARVEPVLDTGPAAPTGPATPLRPIDPTASRGPIAPGGGGP